MRGDGIGEHQGVLGFLVPEEIVDAFFFEQSLHEAQVALAVLDAEFACAVGVVLDRPRFDIGQPVLGQHRFHDGKRVLCGIVENAAIGGEVEQAQPRPDLGRVARVELRGPALGKPGHDAVKEALLAGVELDAHRERLAQHIGGIEVRLLGKQPELELVRSPQFLLPLERLKQQHALGKRPRHRGIAPEECHGYAGTLGVDWVASRGVVRAHMLVLEDACQNLGFAAG